MKPFFLLLVLVPFLAACTVENDFYDGGYNGYQSPPPEVYQPPPPRVRVERPYRSHQHYHRYAPPARAYEERRPAIVDNGNVHGHDEDSSNVHGHDDSANNVHGHDEQPSTNVHGHYSGPQSNVHGHD